MQIIILVLFSIELGQGEELLSQRYHTLVLLFDFFCQTDVRSVYQCLLFCLLQSWGGRSILLGDHVGSDAVPTSVPQVCTAIYLSFVMS